MKISVVIPVYKNVEMFLKNLTINMEFLKDYEVIVVDDASSEDIPSKVHELYPDIIIIENMHNLGFAKSVNKGIKDAKGEFIFLLNSDVRLSDDSFKKSLTHFEDELVFAVSFAQKEKDGTVVGKNEIYFDSGFIKHRKAPDLEPGQNGWAEGGSCILRRHMVQELWGFDELYSPFYWEDIDLSYRAHKRGWKVMFDPEIVAEHHHESTIGKYYEAKRIKTIAYRNQLIFQWKNITDTDLRLSHIASLPRFLSRSLIKKDWSFIAGFLDAVSKWGDIRREREREKDGTARSDKQVLQLFK